MAYLLGLLLTYGLCFGAMQKVGPRIPFWKTLLSCPYCIGFHCGWISWALIYFCLNVPLMSYNGRYPLGILTWSLICAGWCYVVDTHMDRLED